MNSKLVVPITGVFAWSLAAFFLTTQSGPDHDRAQEIAQQQETAPPIEADQIASTQDPVVPIKTAQIVAEQSSMLPIAAAQAAPAPSSAAAPTKVALKVTTPPPSQSLQTKQKLAQNLRQADKEMKPGGFGDACFDQMRTFFCPILAQIPVARDMAGQMALIGGFSCPTGPSPNKG